jgi:hypothetical protein
MGKSLASIVTLAVILGSVAARADELQSLVETPASQASSQMLAQCAGFYVAIAAIPTADWSETEKKNLQLRVALLGMAASHARKIETGDSRDMGEIFNVMAPELKAASSAYLNMIRRRGLDDPVFVNDKKICKNLADTVPGGSKWSPPS